MNAPIATTAGRTLPTRLLRSALAALVLLVAWLGVPLSASAHAQLVSTSPQGGSLLDTSPDAVEGAAWARTRTWDAAAEAVEAGLRAALG